MTTHKLTVVAMFIALTLLTACSGAHLSGTYGDRGVNGAALTFSDDGTLVWQTGDGMSEHARYAVHGNSVELIEMHNNKWTPTHNLQIDDKGCLTGEIFDGAACRK